MRKGETTNKMDVPIQVYLGINETGEPRGDEYRTDQTDYLHVILSASYRTNWTMESKANFHNLDQIRQ